MSRCRCRSGWLRSILAVIASSQFAFAQQIPAKSLPANAAASSKLPAKAEPTSPAAGFVKQALQAELRGEAVQRTQLLAEALKADPEYPPAHWHRGEVRVDGEWVKVADLGKHFAHFDPSAEYRQRREEVKQDFHKELQLARWCVEQGMTDRALLHYANVIHRPEILKQPSVVQEAVKRLELVNIGGRLRTKEEADDLLAEAAAIREATKTWQPSFRKWQTTFERGTKEAQKTARKEMQSLTDHHVTPLVEASLQTASEPWAKELLSLLRKFPESPATAVITRQAVLSPYFNVRYDAVDELKTNRSLHDFVPLLISALSPTTRSQFLVRTGDDFAMEIHYRVEKESLFSIEQADYVAKVAPPQKARTWPAACQSSKSPVGELKKSFEKSETQAAANEAYFAFAKVECDAEQLRIATAIKNQDVVNALKKTTGRTDLESLPDWDSWWKTYTDTSSDKPRLYQQSAVVKHRIVPTSFFTTGTKIATECGLRQIETIQPGDRVLSQNPQTGELLLKVVQKVSLRSASPALRITVGLENITTTYGHPFWVNGRGWLPANEIQVQDMMHSTSGKILVEQTEAMADSESGYNLVVADFNTYFVGEANILVHDNVYRAPTTALVPGLLKSPSQ